MSMQSAKSFVKSAAVWKTVAGIGAMGLLMAWAGGGCGKKIEPGNCRSRVAFPFRRTRRFSRSAPSRCRPGSTSRARWNPNPRFTSARASPPTSGRCWCPPGRWCGRARSLVALDDREIREQLSAADAQLKQAETEFKRARQLMESGAATEQAFVAAETAFNAAQAQAERARVMLSYATIASPIDGIVTDRRIEPGDLANPGQVLAAVYDPTRMRLVMAVPVRLVDKLPRGQKVGVHFSRPDREVSGQVTEIVSEIDPRSRTRTVKIRLDDVESGILPGAFGRIWLDEGEHEAVAVPASAVYRVGQLEFVQVVRGGRVLRRMVKTRGLADGRLEILSGLSAGEQILAQPRMEG